jgi:hypothetical protein
LLDVPPTVWFQVNQHNNRIHYLTVITFACSSDNENVQGSMRLVVSNNYNTSNAFIG